MVAPDDRVKLLIDEARSGPMDARPEVFAEMQALIDDPAVSATDRGSLLAAMAVVKQGDIPLDEFRDQIERAISLLRQGDGDAETLSAAIAVGAGAAAANKDPARCLELCLELLERNADSPQSLDARARNNFGIALTYLGADDSAIENFAIALDEGVHKKIDVMIAAASMNIAVSVAQTTMGRSMQDLDPATSERFESLLIKVNDHLLVVEERAGSQMANLCRAIRTHIQLLCGYVDEADAVWGDLDATTLHTAEGFVQYFCGIEARIRAHRREFDRALQLVERSAASAELLGFPKRDIEGRLVESYIREQMGDPAGALEAARGAVERALEHSKSLPNLLISQLNRRAELESTRRALISRANELVEQTMIDPLSGLGNRRGLDAHADMLRARPGATVAVLLIDIDRFKLVNDSLGHAVGDRLIAEAGALLQRLCSDHGSVFRYGGDEFVVMLEADGDRPQVGTELADRIRVAFSEADWPTDAITCSIGVATGPSASIDDLIRAADVAMYRAKSAGRDRVESSNDTDPLRD